MIGVNFWTSLTDIVKEGEWIWESTNATLTGYTNWLPGKPDSVDQDCMQINYGATKQWDDLGCTILIGGICEQHP